MEKTVAQKTLEILSVVPSEDWITDLHTDLESKCCAIGHYVRLTSNNPDNYNSDNCVDYNRAPIRNSSSEFLNKIHNLNGIDIAHVNNKPVAKYTQDTPKERVIALLNDMIKAGY